MIVPFNISANALYILLNRLATIEKYIKLLDFQRILLSLAKTEFLKPKRNTLKCNSQVRTQNY